MTSLDLLFCAFVAVFVVIPLDLELCLLRQTAHFVSQPEMLHEVTGLALSVSFLSFSCS